MTNNVKVVDSDQVREKLIELVNDARMNAHWHSAKDPTEYVADYLIAHGVSLETKQATSDKASEWIPVTERLPEKSDYYLAFTDTSVVCVLPFSVQYKLFNAFDGDGTRHHIPVTHWMPLPKPPKGE